MPTHLSKSSNYVNVLTWKILVDKQNIHSIQALLDNQLKGLTE